LEIASIATALTSVKTAIEITKAIKGSGDALQKAELNTKMVELLETLVEAKSEIINLKETINEKDQEINNLKQQLYTKENLVFERPYYFHILDNGEKDGPFCQNCYDKDGKLIRLQNERTRGSWHCRTCTCSFQDKNYTPYRPNQNFPKNSGLV
jgi:hypothetical protein